MKIFNLTKYVLVVLCIIFLFLNWKVSIALLLIACIFHVIPLGPNVLLSSVVGFLMVGGVVFIFIDWRIGVLLIISSLVVTKFRLWSNRVNHEFYEKKEKNNALVSKKTHDG